MWKCKKCGEMIDDQFEECWNCAKGIDEDIEQFRNEINQKKYHQTKNQEQHNNLSNEKRSSSYLAGRNISSLISVLGWLIVLMGVISAFTVYSQQGFIGFIDNLVVAIYGLFLVATGQVMLATMDNADNTKAILHELRAKK